MGGVGACVIDCEQTGQWEDCMRSIFMWHRFSRHVRTQQAEDDETEDKHPETGKNTDLCRGRRYLKINSVVIFTDGGFVLQTAKLGSKLDQLKRCQCFIVFLYLMMFPGCTQAEAASS